MKQPGGLPRLPLTLVTSPDGKTTTGDPIEDERLARAVVYCKEQAAKSGKMLFVYEHERHGLEVSTERPDVNHVEVYPGGRTVFRPKRER
jgi:hypothetical protein